MPPLPPGLPSLPGMGGGQASSLGGTTQMQPNNGGLGGTIQTEDMGYLQNLAGLMQMMGGSQPGQNMSLISGGGLI